MMPDQEYRAWIASQSGDVVRDAVWRCSAYRLAAFVQHLAWGDCGALAQAHVTRRIADQLYRAVGSIAANIAEGYSRSSKRDRCRMYEYALGSAREAVVWYRGALPLLGPDVVVTRHELLQQVIRLLLRMIATDRGGQ